MNEWYPTENYEKINDLMIQLREARAEIEMLMKWQPIETAPKNGRDILIFDKNGIEIAWWSDIDSEWCHQDMYLSILNLTHWMPLPEPPK